MWKKSKLLKIIAIVLGLIILVIGLGIFFLFGGFRNFEKNRAEAAIAPFSTLAKDSGGQMLCESGDKGLDPFSGSGGSHSYTTYYVIKDENALVQNIKNLAQQKGYVLAQDADYIENLQYDSSHSNSVPTDRAGITYNAESEYLKSTAAPVSGQYLYIRIYRHSDIVLTCKNPWEKQKAASDNEAILYIFAHGF